LVLHLMPHRDVTSDSHHGHAFPCSASNCEHKHNTT